MIEEDADASDNAAVASMINSKNGFNGDTAADVQVMIPVPDTFDSYYRYQGGLTTPTCNEIVTWTVFSESTKISTAQADEIRGWAGNGVLTGNNRYTKPMNGRSLTYYGPSSGGDDDHDHDHDHDGEGLEMVGEVLKGVFGVFR